MSFLENIAKKNHFSSVLVLHNLLKEHERNVTEEFSRGKHFIFPVGLLRLLHAKRLT